MRKQDNLTDQLDNEVISVPPPGEPINIVDRTPSKASNTIQVKAPGDTQSIKSIKSEESAMPSFSFCLLSSSENAATKANTHHLTHVRAKLKKHLKKMCRRLQAQLQANLDCCIVKIISVVNVNTKKAAKNSPSPLITLFELHKYNQDNQEKLPGSLFESSKQLQVFKHDFKVAVYGQVHWRQILQINTAKDTKDILTNFLLIDEQDLKRARLKHSPDKATV
eukprot:9774809-Ditylum_brightwellii.AAC.1